MVKELFLILSFLLFLGCSGSDSSSSGKVSLCLYDEIDGHLCAKDVKDFEDLACSEIQINIYDSKKECEENNSSPIVWVAEPQFIDHEGYIYHGNLSADYIGSNQQNYEYVEGQFVNTGPLCEVQDYWLGNNNSEAKDMCLEICVFLEPNERESSCNELKSIYGKSAKNNCAVC